MCENIAVPFAFLHFAFPSLAFSIPCDTPYIKLCVHVCPHTLHLACTHTFCLCARESTHTWWEEYSVDQSWCRQAFAPLFSLPLPLPPHLSLLSLSSLHTSHLCKHMPNFLFFPRKKEKPGMVACLALCQQHGSSQEGVSLCQSHPSRKRMEETDKGQGKANRTVSGMNCFIACALQEGLNYGGLGRHG